MKAKLAYLSSSESWGGLEMNHVRDAIWMRDRGHQVVIICVANSPMEAQALEQNLEVTTIEKQKKYYDFKKAKTLVAEITNKQISHLIVRSTYDISLLASVKHRLKNEIHTTYILGMQLGVKKKNLMHTIRYSYIDTWIVPLAYLAKQVREWTNYKNALHVIPSGLDLNLLKQRPDRKSARQKLQLPENELLFGLIGRFDAQKGQLLLLEAMQETRNKNYSVVFLGEPTKNEGKEYLEKMNEKLEDEDLNSRIHIRPFREDPETFYAAVDWVVMATKAETFGMVTIESIACGTPVLGSNAGGTPDILRNETAGILFNTQDSSDLADKIDKIIDEKIQFNQVALEQMGLDYDYNKICEDFEKAIGLS